MVFYLLHGADRIICVEADPKKVALLKKNAKIAEKRFHATVDVVSAWLDNIKLDIDGGEEGMVMEKHFVGYWKEVGHSKGVPAASRVYRLKRAKLLDNLFHAKELMVIKFTQPKEIYEMEKKKDSRN